MPVSTHSATIHPSTINMSNRILWHVVNIMGKKTKSKWRWRSLLNSILDSYLHVSLLGIGVSTWMEKIKWTATPNLGSSCTHCPTLKPWATCCSRNDSLAERPLQHQLPSFELSCPWGALHTFQSGTGPGYLKTKLLPSSRPEIPPHNPGLAFVVQNAGKTDLCFKCRLYIGFQRFNTKNNARHLINFLYCLSAKMIILYTLNMLG